MELLFRYCLKIDRKSQLSSVLGFCFPTGLLKQGKPSGYRLKKLNDDYLDSIIKNLEVEETKYAKPH